MKNESPPVPLLHPLLYAAALLMAGLLLPFVWLREDPQFWTHAGGHPLWLRDLVEVAYYPLLLAYVGLLTCLSWGLLRRPSRFVKLFYAEALVLVLLWAVLVLVASMMLANNIGNLIQGRPLHDHSMRG